MLNRAREMREACAGHGVPLPGAALQFTLHHPAVTGAVIGARTAEEITVDVSYLGTRIPGVLWAEMERVAANAVSPIRPLGLTDRILPDQVKRTE